MSGMCPNSYFSQDKICVQALKVDQHFFVDFLLSQYGINQEKSREKE